MTFVLFFLGAIAVILAIRYSGEISTLSSRFVSPSNQPTAGANQSANPAPPAQQAGAQAGGATPAAPPAITPPPNNPLVWVMAVVAVILTILLLPWGWTISIFGSSIFWRIASAIGLYTLVSNLLFRQNVREKMRGQIMAVAFFLLVLVIIGQVAGSGLSLGVPSGVKSFFTSRPVPETIWRETKMVEAPAKVDWSKATEVQLPWAISKWGIFSLTEPPKDGGKYLELMADGWDKPFQVKGRENFRLPTLPGDRKFKIRSLTEETLTIEVRWR